MAGSRLYVSLPARRLQTLFNQGKYWDRLKRGELTETVTYKKHRSPPSEPFCTHSMRVTWRDPRGTLIADCHQYVRPDGTLGASGKPDPKRLRIGNTIYVLAKLTK